MSPAAILDIASDLAATRRPVAQARTLPAAVYTTPEILAIEQAGLFARTWLCVGRAADIPAAGDFFTRELAGDSVIVIRGDDGLVRAFFNVCRHRGSRANNARPVDHPTLLAAQGRCRQVDVELHLAPERGQPPQKRSSSGGSRYGECPPMGLALTTAPSAVV